MKILVIGGAGFIGSNLTDSLISKGFDVVVLDNLLLGSLNNLTGVPCKFVRGDANNEELLKKHLTEADYVFFQAGLSSAPMYELDPPKTISESLIGFLNTLELSKRAGVKRVVYASSSSIYSSTPPPHSENQPIPEPISYYSETKISMERFARLYTKSYKLETIGLRYFSVYGPKEKVKGRYANVAHQFLWDIIAGKQPVIYGDGNQTRDFIHVYDVVESNLLALNNGTPGEVYNVGTGVAHSFNQLVQMINEYMETKIKPKYVENPIQNYVMHTLAEVNKSKQDLKFTSKISLSEGIKELIRRERSS